MSKLTKAEQERVIKQQQWDLDWALAFLKKSLPLNAMYEYEQNKLIARLEKYKIVDDDED